MSPGPFDQAKWDKRLEYLENPVDHHRDTGAPLAEPWVEQPEWEKGWKQGDPPRHPPPPEEELSPEEAEELMRDFFGKKIDLPPER